MLGHVAQSVGGALPGAGGNLDAVVRSLAQAGDISWTLPRDGTLEIWGWGRGSTGVFSGTVSSQRGGAGGGAGYRRAIVAAGGTVRYEISTAGTLTVTLPDGSQCVANAGGTQADQRLGGTATGWDISRTGGNGATSTIAATAGVNGGAPGSGGIPGGGAAGFSDVLSAPFSGGKGVDGGTGQQSNPVPLSSFPGGGGAGGNGSNVTINIGGEACVVLVLQ